MGLEQCWAALRRGVLRQLFPGHVARWATRLNLPDPQGRVVDARDLKYLRPATPSRFSGPDPWAWRGRMGLARHGLGEALVFTLLLAPCWMGCAGLAVWLHPAWWVGFLPFFIWHAFTIAFFRDPERSIPAGAGLVVSPADGKITAAGEIDMPDFPGGRALRVSIFLSVFSVHINRAPFPMTVARVRYFPGLFLDARHADCAERNEQLWLDGILDGGGQPVRLKQISGAIARRIVCWVTAGDHLAAGERFGLIKFGSRTDLILPVGLFSLKVAVGDGVWGGTTVLAERLPGK